MRVGVGPGEIERDAIDQIAARQRRALLIGIGIVGVAKQGDVRGLFDVAAWLDDRREGLHDLLPTSRVGVDQLVHCGRVLDHEDQVGLGGRALALARTIHAALGEHWLVVGADQEAERERGQERGAERAGERGVEGWARHASRVWAWWRLAGGTFWRALAGKRGHGRLPTLLAAHWREFERASQVAERARRTTCLVQGMLEGPRTSAGWRASLN